MQQTHTILSMTGQRDTLNNWTQYAALAARTAIYPNRGSNLAYAALGLAGETAELLNADDHEQLTEAGDVCWYIAAICHETGIDPAVLDETPGRPANRQDTDSRLALVAAVGQIAEAAKKAIRDDGGQVTDRRRAAIRNALHATVQTLDTLVAAAGSNLEEVRGNNIAKLAARQEKGTLLGDGDHR